MTKRQEIFIKEYILEQNGAKAARKAGYSAKYADKIASRLLKDVEISRRIDEEFKRIVKQYEFTEADVFKGLGKLLEKDSIRDADAIRAWELIGKAQGMFKDNTVNVSIYQQVGKDKVDKARKLLRSKGLQ